MRSIAVAGLSLLVVSVAAAQGTPLVLNATPTTVVWGYYWSKAKPVLTVHSGDTVRMQTLSTCGPNERLEEEGVNAADIPAYNQPIFDQVKDKGPGGHILTGPIYIEGAEPSAYEWLGSHISPPVLSGHAGEPRAASAPAMRSPEP